MKIFFSGGGTLGPVTPLLAIHEVLKDTYKDAMFVWVGTKTGPEKLFVEDAGMTFIPISSGKLRRYFSFVNIFDVVKIAGGFFQSLILLAKESPDVCISASGYVSVPLHWAAWFMGIPTWIHQQDVDVVLANRLMAPTATKITTALEQHLKQFPKRKTSWIGNPVRKDILSGSKESARKRFNLNNDLPVIFVTGGGTGSLRVNQLLVEALPHLASVCQIIHLSGKERPQEMVDRAEKHFDTYHPYQFFTDEMKDAYAVADIIISRGGFGTISEIAALEKPAMLVPKIGHQINNVAFLEEQGAVLLINEETSDGLYLAKKVKELLEDETKRKQLGKKLHSLLPLAKGEKIVEIVGELIK